MKSLGTGSGIKDRFELRRRLGQGGMGVVWEALDRRDQALVALKTLRHVEPRMLFRFKNEFRALADLQHPNLVRLGELFADGDVWFFTMELVPGQDFLHWVRGESPLLRPDPNAVDPLGGTDQAGTIVDLPPRAGSEGGGEGDPRRDGRRTTAPRLQAFGIPPDSPLDEERLRDALSQLAAGLSALHAAGKVHRDVKPSNVMCTFDGRVVLLDFGLVAERGASADTDSQIVGTAAYMAPEQAASQPIGPEADWYAVGAMLFEALVGQPPFVGAPLAVLMDKQRREAPDPRTLRDGLPEDLCELACKLLAREPAARRPAVQALAGLAASQAPASLAAGTVHVPFVGRAGELASLRQAWQATRAGEGRAVTMVVHGESGIGKSTLVRQFLATIEHEGAGALVLSSRCYERESVPFKAFDGLVDALSTALARVDPIDAALLVPHDAASLARLFPVLRRVPALDRLPELRVAEPKELRTRAFSALRELLTRMAERRPLVVFIDDFQWADKDSLALLAHVMQGAWAPPLLLVVTLRDDAGPAPAELTALADVRRLEVLGLAPADARGLVEALSGGARSDGAALAADAGGHPLFLQELVRYAGSGGGRARLDEALARRAQALDPAARRLLDVIAVAGEPIPVALAVEAARLAPGEGNEALPLLRAAHMVRAVRAREGELVECYHDRVRESVSSRLPAERARAIHVALAAALEARGAAASMPLSLVRHLEAAGEPARAAHLAAEAARRAADTLAFDQAAELYRTALRLGGPSSPEAAAPVRRALADALVNAGRTAEAAEEYLVAAEHGDAGEKLTCRSKAAEHLLGTGQVPRGLAVLEGVLADFGEAFPATPARTLVKLLWHRMRLRLRGLHFSPRDPSEVKPRDLALIDVYRAVSVGMGLVDNVRGAYFQARGTLRALDVGETGRVVRAMGLESIYQSSSGGTGRARAAKLVERTLDLAARSSDPFMRAWSYSSDGIVAYVAGDFRKACDTLPRAEAVFRDETVGNAWEINTVRIFHGLALRHAGRFAELRQLYDQHVPDAVRRGDLYTETTLARATNMVWLAADDPRGAQDDLGVRHWPTSEGTFMMQNWYEWRARADIALYTGEPLALAAEVDQTLDALRRSYMLRMQTVRGEAWWLAGRLALAGSLLVPDEQAAEWVDRAAGWAKKLRKEDAAYLKIWGQLLDAGVAARRGERERAGEILRHAAHAAEVRGLAACAAAAQAGQAIALGGELGTALQAGAEDAFKALGVKNARRFAAMLAPGFAQPR